jgi:putative effector of murein hydrolase
VEFLISCASAPLALSLGHPRSSVALGMAIGIAYAVGTRRTPQAYVDNLMAAGALGVPLWGLISLIALPLLSELPRWNSPIGIQRHGSRHYPQQ